MDPPVLERRDLLRAAGSVGLLPVAGCSGLDTDPAFSVPATALTDESIGIEIDGLDPRTSVLVRASAQSRNGTTWESRARFEVDDTGSVSVPERAPVDGTYEGADAMGLFWSKRPADAEREQPLPPDALFLPDASGYDVALTAEVDGEAVAEATTTRRLYDPEIERRTVDHPDVVGEFFAPPGDESAPGVVHLHGVGGEPHLAKGRLLASRGFATLALHYFGEPEPIPDALTEVPLEYVEAAVAWLRDQDRVAGPEVGLVGFSRGGELALLAGSRGDDVGAVVGWVPSGIAWEGVTAGRDPAGVSAWSVGGEPVPYLEMAEADLGPPPNPGLPFFAPALSEASEDELEAASIPVEEADAPVFLASATDDRRWPSTAMSARVVRRLDAREYAHEYRHDSHAGAGHYVRLPYLPTAGTRRGTYDVYGGSQASNARASVRTWFETLSVLESALGD